MIAISLFMMYIVYCYVMGRVETVEHLISSKSDKLDVLTKFSLNWLKNKAKTMDIPKGEISKNLLPKEAYANSIIRYLPRAHREYMMKLSTYSNDRLKEEAFRHGVGVVGKSRRQIMDGIKTATNPDQERGRLVEEYGELFANPYKAASLGYIDDVVEPRETRSKLCKALEMLLDKQEERPARKHGNIPL